MGAIELLDEIFNNRTVYDLEGNSYDLGSNVDIEEGEFLRRIIKENNSTDTIEIGCAYGISSLNICAALTGNKDSSHTIIDPFQSTRWKNIGKSHLDKAGIDFYEVIEKPSEIALPHLLSSGKKYDFGFIDGWHTFDHTLIDFFYLNRLVKVGGVIVIDDVNWRSINKCLRYILNYPSYEIIGNVDLNISSKRKYFDLLIRAPFRILASLLPQKVSNELFASKVIKSDKSLKLESSMIAVKKISDDERPWHWYKEF
jgi:predicted O-methyltransferase YrrM